MLDLTQHSDSSPTKLEFNEISGLTREYIGSVAKKADDGGAVQFACDNVLKPLANGILDGANTAANMVNGFSKQFGQDQLIPKQELYVVPQASVGSAAWICQAIAGGAGAVVPYVVAGKFAGAGMRTIGRAAGAEGLSARLLASDSVAQVAGAGLMDGWRDLKPGETAAGNAAAGMIGFGVFEALNPATRALSFTQQIAARAAVGVVGSTAQNEAHAIFSSRHLTWGDRMETALHGAVLNAGLPAVQTGITRALSMARLSVGMGVPVRDYVDLHGLEGRSFMLDSLVRDVPLTTVHDTTGLNSRADAKAMSVFLAERADAADLGHELTHVKMRGEQAAAQQSAKQLLADGNEAGAREALENQGAKGERTARVNEAQIASEFGFFGHDADRAMGNIYARQISSAFDALKQGKDPGALERVLYNDRLSVGKTADDASLPSKEVPAPKQSSGSTPSEREMAEWKEHGISLINGRYLAEMEAAVARGDAHFTYWDRDYLRSHNLFARDVVRPQTQAKLGHADYYDPMEATQNVYVVNINGQYHIINGNNRLHLFGSYETNPDNLGIPVWFFKNPETFQQIFKYDVMDNAPRARRVRFD